MPIASGRRLGPYEVVAPLGAGGMGEVYRARDTRLGREVALKVLPPEHAGDPERQRRFEREARAVAALSHPNILALHDAGAEDGTSYAVFELLEGETLRARLERGPLPVRKVVELAVQVCRGLAAAHTRGIVHRDLKPENLALTDDGRIKILDFGLARLAEAAGATAEGAEMRTATAPGLMLGTVGYMSPEQVRGQPADARSDIFSLGATVYEMVTGRRAFAAATPADTISSILHRDPAEMASGLEPVPDGLLRIVRRCLEKEPDDRFQTARDLAFALESFSGSVTPPAAPAPPRWTWILAAGGALMMAALGIGAFVWFSRPSLPVPVLKLLTFRRGMVLDARFTADGNTVAYSALFDGNPAETYSVRLDRPEALRLDLPPARLVGLSSSGELALILGEPGERRAEWVGTLARIPLAGGTPREVLDQVFWADWSPDGNELAVVRLVDGRFQLEYPVGHVLQRPLQERGGAAFGMRVSPRGDRVAYTAADDVVIVDRGGRTTTLAAGSLIGLAWDPAGDAVWVSIRMTPWVTACDLWRLGLDGTRRLAARFPGPVMLHDVARDGRLLVHTGFERQGIRGRARGEATERELGVFVYGMVGGLTADGSQLLVWDSMDKGGDFSPFVPGWVFLRSMEGGSPIRLARGWPVGLSADGKSVFLVRDEDGRQELVLMPTGPGASRTLNTEGLGDLGSHIGSFEGAASFVDDSRVLLDARSPNGRVRTYLLDLRRGKPVAVTPEGTVAVHGSLTGGRFLVVEPDRTLGWYSLDGGEVHRLPTRLPLGLSPLSLASDRRVLYVVEQGNVPGRLDRFELATGRRTPWRILVPDDTAGVVSVQSTRVTADGRAYAYSYTRYLQDLYLVDGLR